MWISSFFLFFCVVENAVKCVNETTSLSKLICEKVNSWLKPLDLELGSNFRGELTNWIQVWVIGEIRRRRSGCWLLWWWWWSGWFRLLQFTFLVWRMPTGPTRVEMVRKRLVSPTLLSLLRILIKTWIVTTVHFQ